MKQFVVATVTIAFLGIAIPARAQSSVGVEFKTAEGVEVSGLLQGLFKKAFPVDELVGEDEFRPFTGFYVFGLADQSSWAQIHGGLSYNPAKWVGFTAGVGTETGVQEDDAHWRAAWSTFVDGRGNSAFVAMEFGGSGMWYRVHYLRTITPRLRAGAFSRRYSPSGPFVEVKLSQKLTAFTVAGPNLETGEKMVLLGLDVGLPW